MQKLRCGVELQWQFNKLYRVVLSLGIHCRKFLIVPNVIVYWSAESLKQLAEGRQSLLLSLSIFSFC